MPGEERLYLRLDGDPPDAPGSSVPPNAMTELTVWPSLRHHVAHIVAYRETFDEETVERVLPDGATRLIFHVGEPLHTRSAIEIAGASTEAAVLRMQGTVAGISVTLRPGAVQDTLGIPAFEVAGQVLPLEEIWPSFSEGAPPAPPMGVNPEGGGGGAPSRKGEPETSSIEDRLRHAPDDAVRGAIVQELLQARVKPTSSQANRAASLVAREAGSRSIAAIAGELGLSERRLQQVFRHHVGLTPRALGLIARMQACLRTLRGDAPPSWARIATEAGFYDQAHLANELRRLSGLTPSALLRRVSGSSKTPPPAGTKLPT